MFFWKERMPNPEDSPAGLEWSTTVCPTLVFKYWSGLSPEIRHVRSRAWQDQFLCGGSAYFWVSVKVSCILHVSGLSPWRPRWTSAVGQCIQGILACISSLYLETSLYFCCRTVYSTQGILACISSLSLETSLYFCWRTSCSHLSSSASLLITCTKRVRDRRRQIKEVLGSVKRLFTIFLFHTVNLTNILVCPWLTD